MTESEVRDAVRTAVACAPSLRSLAKTWGVAPSHLSDICNGRRGPGPAVLKHFGLVRKVVVTYEPAEESKGWPRAKGVPSPP